MVNVARETPAKHQMLKKKLHAFFTLMRARVTRDFESSSAWTCVHCEARLI